jgi:hypothetical protein
MRAVAVDLQRLLDDTISWPPHREASDVVTPATWRTGTGESRVRADAARGR